MEKLRTIGGNGVFLNFTETERGLFIRSVTDKTSEKAAEETFLPFVVCTAERSSGTFGAFSSVLKSNVGAFVQTDIREENGALKLTYESETFSCRVETEFTFVPSAAAFYMKNILTAREDIVLTDFFSVLPLEGFGSGYLGEYSLMYRRNRWQAEGQWYEKGLRELGFTDMCRHMPMNKFSVTNTGSQTTSEYYPCFIVKNKKSRREWYFENEAQGNWFMELTEHRKWDGEQGTLLLAGGSIQERNLFSLRKVRAGERIETPISLVAFAQNASLTESVCKAKRYKNIYAIQEPAVIYNDYMNCLWSKPKLDEERSLIDACARLGVKYYVIDDGWFCFEKDTGNRLGDWNTDGDIWGDAGLQGVFDLIRRKGMLPGVWMECETVGENSQIYKKRPDLTITVGGKSYGSRPRHFLDFRKEETARYLREKIAKLYDMGVRYIKTDYNDSYLYADAVSENENAGLWENYRCVLDFYRQLGQAFPDLILESCASGGMREDEGFLKYFRLQSASDQEEYYNYPSIICGSLRNTLPEKLGIWCMPYPIRYSCRALPIEKVPRPQFEEMIFNLVSGMNGVLYLSSRIDMLDMPGTAVIKEGISLYKKIFPVISQSYPVFPLGITRAEDKQHAVLWRGGGADLLCLWATGKREFIMDGAEEFEQIFPAEKDSDISPGKIVLKGDVCARIFGKKGESL